MIEFSNCRVYNWVGAIRGMRNSWESHDKIDSYITGNWIDDSDQFVLGENDKALMLKLIKAGASHAKFTRQILVSVDIDAPLYWWKEFDQYKVATVTNSESTMHTIQKYPIDRNRFSLDDADIDMSFQLLTDDVLQVCENLRQKFLETKDKKYWRLLIQLLPSGWMQLRTTTLNYGVIANAYHDRKAHRLTEWREDFKDWVHTLPYSFLITGEEK